jgi:hypothetical protein
VDGHFHQIRSTVRLRGESTQQLIESGFAIMPGPLAGDRLNQLVAAYDEVMASASGPDYKAGRTTTRMSDLLSNRSEFDDVFLYPPLIEACCNLIGEPFKLSSFIARTLQAGSPAQELHADLPRDSDDGPLLGFILMVDPFRVENGATRFVPASHYWPDLPSGRLSDTRNKFPGEVLACGDLGSMSLFNGAIWHGHTANLTAHPRRSIQGYFVRRQAQSGFDFRNRLPPAARSRMSALARYLLALDD